MQTQTKYITLLHTEYVDRFLNPKTDCIPPNLTLRNFIVSHIKSGKAVSPTLIAREYLATTGKRVSQQRVRRLLVRLGVYAK